MPHTTMNQNNLTLNFKNNFDFFQEKIKKLIYKNVVEDE